MTTKNEVISATPVGSYAFYGEFQAGKWKWTPETFSVGIFRVVEKSSGQGKKAEPAIARISAPTSFKDWLLKCAEYVCWCLNGYPPTTNNFVQLRALVRKYRAEYCETFPEPWKEGAADHE